MTLNELLKRKGYSQIRLAAELGISDGGVSKWLRWNTRIPPRHVSKICQLLNCSPADLVQSKKKGVGK